MYSTAANAARVRAKATEYHAVSRPRSVCILRLHDVAYAPHRVNQLRLTRVVDLAAQSGDHHIDDIRAGIEVIVPGVFRDERPRHHAPLLAHQVLDHPDLLGPHPTHLPAA